MPGWLNDVHRLMNFLPRSILITTKEELVDVEGKKLFAFQLITNDFFIHVWPILSCQTMNTKVLKQYFYFIEYNIGSALRQVLANIGLLLVLMHLITLDVEQVSFCINL